MDRNELFFDSIEDRQELAVIDIEEEDGEVREYAVLAIFSSPPYAYEYMAAMSLEDINKPAEEQETAFLRYTEEEDGFILEGIDNDVELEFVSDYYFNRLEEEYGDELT